MLNITQRLFYLICLFSIFALPGLAGAQVTLWDQPVSTVNAHPYHNQDYDNFPESDMWISDDFENTETWHITSIFVPGGFVTDVFRASTLGNAKSLSWYVYGDNGGKPEGHPRVPVSPVWSISLAPSDPQISITKGWGNDPSNVTLNLLAPPRIAPGRYWFIFSPEIKYNLYGEHGRQPSDTEFGYDAQVIQPTGTDGFPTEWTSVLDPIVPWVQERFPPLAQQDFAFRLEGSSFPSTMDTNPRSVYFGNVLTGQTSASRIVTIANTGSASFLISVIGITSGEFELAPGPSPGCSLTNQTLAPGTSCTVSITFMPSTAGAQSASLTINTNLVPAVAHVPLLGIGIDASTETREGTIGTVITFTDSVQGFTNKKGKVFIYDGTKKVGMKIGKDGWTNDRIIATVNKALLPGTYNVRIEFKRDKNKEFYDAGTFTYRKPVIDSLTASEGLPGSRITLAGQFFSTKRGKVYLEYQAKNVACKIISWAMNSITFEVPKLPARAYPLRVSNKVGTSAEEITFTIKQ